VAVHEYADDVHYRMASARQQSRRSVEKEDCNLTESNAELSQYAHSDPPSPNPREATFARRALRSPANQFNHSQQNAFANHEVRPEVEQHSVEQTSLENYDQEVGSYVESSFSEDEEEHGDRLSVE
jgi:phage protein D